jgi:hypothetical protein
MGASVTAGADRQTAAGFGRARGVPLMSLFSRYGELAGYILAAIAVYVGWVGHGERNIDAGSGLGYALGIVGGSLMLILLLYSARKRARWLARFGATKHWFRIHMLLGIIGPVLILYHCNFELGDLNSKVALFCTLLVAGSGVVGRFLYEGIHHGLYGSKTTLKELSDSLAKSIAGGQASTLIAPIHEELKALDRRVLTPPDSIADSVTRHFTIAWQTRRIYWRLLKTTRRELMRKSMTSQAVDQHADRLEESVRRYLRDHLGQVRQVARFNAFERLFSLWHVVHVPFFIMMILTALFHVFAVHLY